MAELERDELYEFTAAATALTLSTGRKLIRNFSYYRTIKSDRVYRDELFELCINIRSDAFSLHNLITNTDTRSPFFVALAGRIGDRFEELHRKLLFFDPALISEMISPIDRQRTFWTRAADPGFYDIDLVAALEHELPEMLFKIELELKRLPDTAIL
jgi:hypothetical protein